MNAEAVVTRLGPPSCVYLAEIWAFKPTRGRPFVFSDRQQMAGALGGRPTALVVDLGGGDVAVAKEILDLHNIHIPIQ